MDVQTYRKSCLTPKEATKTTVMSKTNLNKICKYWFLYLPWSIYRDRQEIKVIIYLHFDWDYIKIVWSDLIPDAVNGQNSTVIQATKYHLPYFPQKPENASVNTNLFWFVLLCIASMIAKVRAENIFPINIFQ